MLPCWPQIRKIFNRNTLKLSYSCMPNVQQIIKGHNQTVLKNLAQPAQDQAERACNCKKKEKCPLVGNCLGKGIVYQAQVTAACKTETYVGLTSTEFKARFRNHQVSFNNKARKNDTELSKHISGSLKAKNNASPLNGRSWPRQNLTPTLQNDAIYAQRRSISSSPNWQWQH